MPIKRNAKERIKWKYRTQKYYNQDKKLLRGSPRVDLTQGKKKSTNLKINQQRL
jgi:hypothetical protein